uniref:PAXX non-homologous end joining factor n=1 Tax=Strigops habroptila TaxID=2489341 RepID=A0A672UEK8_STRHB
MRWRCGRGSSAPARRWAAYVPGPGPGAEYRDWDRGREPRLGPDTGAGVGAGAGDWGRVPGLGPKPGAGYRGRVPGLGLGPGAGYRGWDWDWGRVPGPGTRAGGRGWARRFRDVPSFSRAAVPAGGARREAQVCAVARGDRPRPRPRAPLTPARPRREALGRGAASLSPGERPGTLRLRGGAACSALELCPLPAAEARSQLRALLFGMAGHIESLERRLSVVETLASSCSPEKSTTQSQQQFLPDPKPGKNRGAGSTLPARRKIPGESLINPGFKSKKAPSGVDFEDS